MALAVLNVESQYLHSNTEISVILPNKPRDQEAQDYYTSGKKYKVLWLLHGTYGDHSDWLRHTNIELYACEKNLMVVMPSALNSDYSNWDGFAMGYSMFDFVPKELMPLVQNWLPASDKREDNFIAGLSMGGEGAMKYAVHYPDKFAAAAILSMPIRNPRWPPPRHHPAMAQRRANVLSNAGGPDGYINSYQNLWDRLPDLVRKGVLPRLFFSIGTKDFGFEEYLDFKKYAGEIGLKAEFEEVAGFQHEWRFWDLAIQHALTFFGLDK